METELRVSSFRTEARRWRAVVERLTGADGVFFYGVLTTGVFCRPTCPARRPRRENAVFFDSVEEAKRAGYRPCKRCKPDAPGAEREQLERACALLGAERGAQTREVATELGLSNGYFQRWFKRELGVTPQQYRRRVLAERGREALTGSATVTGAAYRAGYSGSSRFYAGVGRELGMNPAAARAGGAGELVRYAVRRCSLGQVLVAWTERGVCQVSLADTAKDALAELEGRLPKAELELAEGEWAERVIRAVDTGVCADVPLDLRGTAFQERVWQLLRDIPVGETLSYTELAQRAGSGPRAVARACASNALAVVIPCHRVVRQGGELAGYRWGVERKRKLLVREGGRGRDS